MLKNPTLKDLAAEKRLFQQRMIWSLLLFLIVIAGLFLRYLDLQYFQHKRFVTESDRNRIHMLPVEPRRGLIYDRNGLLLAENQPSYSLAITKERVQDLDELLIDLQQLFDIDNESIEKFQQRLKRRTPYQAVPLKFKLNDDEISRFAVNRYRLDGVEIQAQLVRHYPLPEQFSHTLGYVGRINAKEQEQLFADPVARANYAATDYIGKIGLEQYYESILHGQAGAQYVETNAHGKVLRVLQQFDPKPGQDITLSVDARLQSAIHTMLQGKRGSVVVLDVKSGEVLAMVSVPSYNPNLFVTGISEEDYSELRDSRDLPLFNRSLQGQYPPGSTTKPIIGLAGLHYNVVSPESTVRDPGWYQLPNDERFYRDWKRGGHAEKINMQTAIVESCDVYFYDLSYRLGIDRIHAFMSEFGLGEPTGIDSSNERAGLLPSREWKRASKNKPWFPGETLNAGIGQGYMLATPLQLAVATATLANSGAKPVPSFIRKSGDGSQSESVSQWAGEVHQKGSSGEEGSINWRKKLRETRNQALAGDGPGIRVSAVASVSEAQWRHIHQSMVNVVHSPKGTAFAISRGSTYRMAGKTGTAQVIGIAQGEQYDEEAIAERQRDHALFVGYAPASNPKVAVSVVIENGGSGSSAAAPIARKVFDWIMENNEERTRPLRTGQPLYAWNQVYR